MTEPSHSPTVRLRSLSAQLRALREACGMTAAEVSRRLEWSAGKVTRMERAEWKRPNVRDVQDLLDLYGVTDAAKRDALIQLARQARVKGWWDKYKNVFTGSYVGLEAEASWIRTFEPLVIPGLLQTADYTAALARAALIRDPKEVEQRVAARLERQKILGRRNAPQLWAVIDEAALRKPVGGPEVMAAQLRHLIEMNTRPNVAIQVLPDSAGAHAAMQGQFVILDFPEETHRSVVYIETAFDGLYLEEPDELARYTLIYDWIRSTAFNPDESSAYLRRIIDQLTK